MGQAFDRKGNVLGEAFGATKREVFNKLSEAHPNAHEIRLKTIEAKLALEQTAMAEMPRYSCHKEVWALKIKSITTDAYLASMESRESDGSALLQFDPPYSAIRVTHDYMRKHSPRAGGYYVVYKDGYASFSPADAFEDGYTRI